MSISTRKRAREEDAMSPTPGKRARNEGNMKDHNNEKEFCDMSDQLQGNGNTEIFSTLIPMMRNVNILKHCRLVCKSWNQFACRALRKHSRVYYSVYENCPDETESHLKLIVRNVQLGLPSPFRLFKITATSLQENTFLRFLKYLEGTTSNFLMDLTIRSDYDGVHQAKLQAVLTCNQNSLKIIKLTLSRNIIGEDRDGGIFQPEVIRLPYLRTLQISEDSFNEDKVVSLCENICRYSPLQSLKIWSKYLGDGLKKIISSLAMKSIEKLWLIFNGTISHDVWSFLRAKMVEIQGIKKLLIYHGNCSTDLGRSYYGFETVISHFADSLESLSGDYLPRLIYKNFPKLREIEDSAHHIDFHYPLERYPLLRKATFYVCCNRICRDNTAEPNLAIEQLCLESLIGTDLYSLLKIISMAGWRFPNVSNFSLKYGKIQFASAILSAICKSFPKLTTLELRVDLKDKKTLSGLPRPFAEWLHEGWPLERIPREASLLDFPGLESLTLGSSVTIRKHLFLYCFSKIPKLQYLTFYLNGYVSAIDVRDSVGHLKRITVIVLKHLKPKKEWVEEMKRLRVMLPAIVKVIVRDTRKNDE